jgi:hypothetical protein
MSALLRIFEKSGRPAQHFSHVHIRQHTQEVVVVDAANATYCLVDMSPADEKPRCRHISSTNRKRESPV